MIYYLICSTPRTGNNYFVKLLQHNGIGNPNWYITRMANGMEAACLDTLYAYEHEGVWGCIMENYKERFSAGIQMLRGFSSTSENESYIEVLREFFPGIKFIYLYREDYVKQAISFDKAIQSQCFSRYTHSNSKVSDIDYQFRPDCLRDHLAEIVLGNQRWNNFYESSNVTPYSISYEMLVSKPEEVIRSVASFLGIKLHKFIYDTVRLPIKLSDSLNDEFYKRFLYEE